MHLPASTRAGAALCVFAIALTVSGAAHATDYERDKSTVITVNNGMVTSFPSGLAPVDGVVHLGPDDTVTRTGTATGSAIYALGASSIVVLDGTDLTSSASYTSDADLASLVRSFTGAHVEITGGILTSTGESYARGLFTAGGYISDDSSTISTLGIESDAIHAYRGGIIELSRSIISTSGDDSSGLYSEKISTDDVAAKIAGTDVIIATHGDRSYGAFAEEGGTIDLHGGRIDTNGEASHGIVAGLSSHIDVADTAISTTGNEAHGLVADPLFNPDAEETPDGIVASIMAKNVSVQTQGARAAGASARNGGHISISGGSIAAMGPQGSALAIAGSGKIEVESATLSAQDGPTAGIALTSASDLAEIALGNGVVATGNDGRLLHVSRTGDGSGGQVELTLAAGSVTKGDIVDSDAKTGGGGTDVKIEGGADWTGTMQGVADLAAGPGAHVAFDQQFAILGDLTGDGVSFSFGSLGGVVVGNVRLQAGSSTTGGTVDNPVIVGNSVFVDQTSALGGNWSILGNLESAGKIAPGNSIGIDRVGGDLLLEQSSNYVVEINRAGKSDLIQVAGDAHLDGIVTVSPLQRGRLDAPYTILTANGSIPERFDGVGFDRAYPFLAANLSYAPDEVLLTVTRNNLRYASVATTPNQAATANALDTLSPNGPLGNVIAFSTLPVARSAFDQLSGEIYASAQSLFVEQSKFLRDAMIGRLRASFGSAAAPGPMPAYLAPEETTGAADGLSLWSSGFGSWGDIDGSGNASGISDSTGGIFAGADASVCGGWRLGLVGGYSLTNFDASARRSSGESDNWHLGIYAGNRWGALGLRGGLAYTWQDVDTARAVAFPGFSDRLSGKYDADIFQTFGELGYEVDSAIAAIEPFANLAYVSLDTDGFSERGGAAALAERGTGMDTGFTTLGLRASQHLAMASIDTALRGTIGWRHAFGDITPVAVGALLGSASFAVDGVPLAEDAALIELGLDALLSPEATLSLSYTGQFGDSVTDNGLNGRLKISF